MTDDFQLLPPNDVDSGWTWGQLEGYANELYARAKLAEERLATAETERSDLEAKLGAATTMLAEAERIVPGVITTAGRFAIGLNDRERALAAEARVEALSEALRGIDATYGRWWKDGAAKWQDVAAKMAYAARSALACPPQQRGE